jgi:addiction module HigA family antidote
VIQSFKDGAAQELFENLSNKRWNAIAKVALRKLDQIDAAQNLNDLRVPPGNQLEALKKDRARQHSIRINDQYRIYFIWKSDGAHQVEITDYHSTANQADGRRLSMIIKRPTSGWEFRRVTTSPGEMLQEEFLGPLGITKNALAMKIRVPATRIGDIIHGKRAITPDTALRLARFFGNSPEFWLNLQQMHDLSKARLELGKTIEHEVEAFVGA